MSKITYMSTINVLKSLLITVFVALIIRSVVFEAYTIPSGSMKPNYMDGDYLFVSKYHYGITKYSFPFSLNLFNGRILPINKPKRGDVVVFRLPSNHNIHYIKRLIGVAGDKIQMRDGMLFINDQMIPRHEIAAFKDSDGNMISRYIERLSDDVSYEILEANDNSSLDNTKTFIVPDNHYFMMGDNRDNSLDSRVVGGPVGYVHEDLIVGTPAIILFSNEKLFSKSSNSSIFNALVSGFDMKRFFKLCSNSISN